MSQQSFIKEANEAFEASLAFEDENFAKLFFKGTIFLKNFGCMEEKFLKQLFFFLMLCLMAVELKLESLNNLGLCIVLHSMYICSTLSDTDCCC